MNTTTWQKACTCEGATATSGRIVTRVVSEAPCGFQSFDISTHFGPVCDRCDKPWVRTNESENR